MHGWSLRCVVSLRGRLSYPLGGRPSWLLTTVQCVPESIGLKRSVLAELDEVAPEDTIIASNSSSYTITEIIDGLPLKVPNRFLSMHSCEFLADTTNMEVWR